MTITYSAFNALTNRPHAGDAANHALELLADGAAAVPLAGTPTDQGDGIYSIAIPDEDLGQMNTLKGESSTAGVIIIPTRWQVNDATAAGASPNTIRVLIGGSPVADADVWISTDADGQNVVAGTLQTDSLGRATFLLDSGVTYYLWAQKDGINAIQGQIFTAE